MPLLGSYRGANRFVLVGLCWNILRLHTAIEDPRVTGRVLLNPQTFEWKEGNLLNSRRARAFSRRATTRERSWTIGYGFERREGKSTSEELRGRCTTTSGPVRPPRCSRYVRDCAARKTPDRRRAGVSSLSDRGMDSVARVQLQRRRARHHREPWEAERARCRAERIPGCGRRRRPYIYAQSPRRRPSTR